MFTKNLKSSLSSISVLVFTLLASCTKKENTEEVKKGIALYAFLAFCFLILISLIVPTLQKTQLFCRIREICRGPAIILGWLIQLAGVIVVFLYFWQSSTEYIYTYVGAVLVVAGFFLIRWARRPSDGPSVELKIVALSISFIVAFIWIARNDASTLFK